MRIDIRNSQPPIWRRLIIGSDVTLHTLHLAIQGAFDWGNYHLYRFSLGHPFDDSSDRFLCQWEVEDGEAEGAPAAGVRLDETLQQPGDLLDYVYDYGDNWDLKIRLEKVRDTGHLTLPAECIDGRRAAPPEDCGSRRDADSLAEVIQNPAFFDVAETNESIAYYFDDAQVDPIATLDIRETISWRDFPKFRGMLELSQDPRDLLDRLHRLSSPARVRSQDQLHETVVDLDQLDLDSVFEPLLWFLNQVGDGIKLTTAGYIPPALALEFEAMLHPRSERWRPRGGESHMRQLLEYRRYLQRLGLVRKSKGMLMLTRAGETSRTDSNALWEHLTERLAPKIDPSRPRDFDADSALITLLHAATSSGDLNVDAVAVQLDTLGWTYGDGRPVQFMDIAWNGSCPAVLFWFMAPLEDRRWNAKRLSPAAVALAHAALTRAAI